MRISALFAVLGVSAVAQTVNLSPQLSSVSFPATGSTILYGVQNNSPMRSEDSGKTWVPLYIFEAGRPQGITQIGINSSNPDVVYAATTMDRGGVWKSVDRGKTWEQAAEGLPEGSAAVLNLTVATNSPNTIYVRVGDSMYRSNDAAVSWTRMGALPAGITEIGIHQSAPAKMFAMGPSGLMYRSDNEGQSWTSVGTLFQQQGRVATQIVVHPQNSTTVFVSSTVTTNSTGRCSVPGAGVYQSSDNGTTWVQRWPSDFCNVTGRILIDPVSTNVYLSTGYFQSGFCRSIDRGTTFTCYNRAQPLGVDPRNGNILGNGGAQISTNRGDSFTSTGATVKVSLPVPAGPLTGELSEGQEAALPFRIETPEGGYAVPYKARLTADPAFSLASQNGQTNQALTVTASAANLASGTYEALLELESEYAVNSPVTIPVAITVAPTQGPGPRFTFTPGPAATLSVSASARDRAGNLYVYAQNRIARINPAGQVTNLVGTGTLGNSPDGPPLQMNLAIVGGVAVDAQGVLYWTESAPDRLRMLKDGVVKTLADQTLTFGGGNFPTRFSSPRGIAVEASGRLLVIAVPGILRFNPSNNQVEVPYSTGNATNVFFQQIALGANGDAILTDPVYHRVYRFRGGQLQAIAGTGAAGFTNDGGLAAAAQVSGPRSVAVAADGTIYFGDSGNRRIRAITTDGRIYSVAGSGKTLPAVAVEGTDARELSLSLTSSSLQADATGNLVVFDLTRMFTLTRLSATAPVIAGDGIVSAANSMPGIAPGGLFALSGTALGLAFTTAAPGDLPLELGQTRVIFNNRSVPLLAVAAERVVGQVPYEIQPGEAKVRVQTPGGLSAEAAVQVTATAPAVLISPEGAVGVLNADGTPNTSENPAARESMVAVLLTGAGVVDPPVKTGAVTVAEPLSTAVALAKARVGEVDIDPVAVTLLPGFVGVAQATVQVPAIDGGEYDLTVAVGDTVSVPVKLYVAP